MRVGVYIDSYRPQDGGAFTMQGDLFRAICEICRQSQHEFVVISAPGKNLESQVRAAGMQWLPYRGPGFGERLTAILTRTFPSLRRRFKPRSAFERNARSAGVEFVWFLGQRTMEIDLPYLTTVWDSQHRKQPWFPEVSEYGEWVTRERRITPFLRRAAAVIVGTEAGKSEVETFFQVPTERIHILPHPTPAHMLAQPQRAPLPVGLQSGYLFYPAQFWAHKNHVNLLHALRLLKDKGLELKLVLAGSDFGNRAHIENTIAEFGLQNQVTILGFVSNSELVALYQNALALTYVSFFGPENLPPLEAFALGCPVIAAQVEGAKEQFGDAALLVDPTDPADIASAIRNVHKDAALRKRLVARGKKRAGKWTAKDFVQATFKLLDGFAPIRRTWKA